MQTVKVGQIWEIYSDKAKAWTTATVTQVLNGQATLRYDHFPEFLNCEAVLLMTEPQYFRLSRDVTV